jgi:hypothetical protein
MTDPELARRVAEIGARRGARSGRRPSPPPTANAGRPRRGRHHPAAASRILALGVSSAALVGLVTLFTVGAPASPATATPVAKQVAPAIVAPPTATAPPRRHVVIIIHRHSTTGSAGGTSTGSSPSVATEAPAPSVARTPSPAPAPVAPAPRPAPVTTSKPS